MTKKKPEINASRDWLPAQRKEDAQATSFSQTGSVFSKEGLEDHGGISFGRDTTEGVKLA